MSESKSWFEKQDEVIVIGISDGVVDIKTPLTIDDTIGIVAIAYDMLVAVINEEAEGQSLQ